MKNKKMIVEPKLADKSVKVWQALSIFIPVLLALIGVGFTFASDVVLNKEAVADIEDKLVGLESVKLNIGTLNEATKNLSREINEIKESQSRTEKKTEKTNDLIRDFISKTREDKIKELQQANTRIQRAERPIRINQGNVGARNTIPEWYKNLPRDNDTKKAIRNMNKESVSERLAKIRAMKIKLISEENKLMETDK